MSRRTIAKTAAWAAPAIALAAASPAHAASDTRTGLIGVAKSSYTVPGDTGTLIITGTVRSTDGGAIPSDIGLAAAFTGGFTVVVPPLVAGDSFTLVVKAPTNDATGTMTISSWNYGGYAPAEAKLVFANVIAPPPPVGTSGRIVLDDLVFSGTTVNAPVKLTGKIIMTPEDAPLFDGLELEALSIYRYWRVITPAVIDPVSKTFEIEVQCTDPVQRLGYFGVVTYSHPNEFWGATATAYTTNYPL